MYSNFKYMILLFLIVGSFWCGTVYSKRNTTIEYKEKVVIDTITRDSLVPTIQYIDRYVDRYVTVYKEKVDTLTLTDTVRVLVPISKYLFKEPEYTIEASGYEVTLDKVETYPKTIYKTEQVTTYKNPKISIGIQAGYGIRNGKPSPYIGIGAQYNIFSINL